MKEKALSQILAIAGNISVGKSTLAEILATRWGWTLFREPEVSNPYLADFYLSPEHWGIHSQIFFLLERYKGHLQLQEANKPAIMDRTIYEDGEIFAYLLLNSRDWQTYRRFYNLALNKLTPPRLVAYLHASPETLLNRLRLRGHLYEKTASLDYLRRLNDRYEEWASSFRRAPLIRVETDQLDFVKSFRDLESIIGQIESILSAQETYPLFT